MMCPTAWSSGFTHTRLIVFRQSVCPESSWLGIPYQEVCFKDLVWAPSHLSLPTCSLVYLRRSTSTWILCGCLVPWPDRLIRGSSETRFSHRLLHYSTYLIGWPTLEFAGIPSLSDGCNKLCCDFFQKICDPLSCILAPTVATPILLHNSMTDFCFLHFSCWVFCSFSLSLLCWCIVFYILFSCISVAVNMLDGIY